MSSSVWGAAAELRVTMSYSIDELFEAFRGRVYRWALALSGRHDEALEVTQDVFLTAARERPSLSQPGAAIAWLRRVTGHRLIDRVRRARAGGLHFVAAETSAEPVASSAPAAADHLIAAEQAERLRAALAELPEQQRLVVLAKTFDDWTFREIAQQLGISIPTAKTHYARGLTSIRARLSAESLKGVARD